VEQTQQLAWLRAHGCDIAQGFLLARPQPFEQLLHTLRTPLAAA
jgi:EAL domain-containing protein (putative c-di-GMP-specific phosphodiesterase class I)